MPLPLNEPVQVKVGDKVYEATPDGLVITGRDDPDLREAAAKYTFWLQVVATARRKLAMAERDYRNWKAVETKKLLATDLKMPDWKREVELAASDDFKLYKRRIADHSQAAEQAEGFARGYSMKVDLLRTLRADRRKELDASTDIDPVFGNPDRASGEARKERAREVKAAMGRGRKGED